MQKRTVWLCALAAIISFSVSCMIVGAVQYPQSGTISDAFRDVTRSNGNPCQYNDDSSRTDSLRIGKEYRSCAEENSFDRFRLSSENLISVLFFDGWKLARAALVFLIVLIIYQMLFKGQFRIEVEKHCKVQKDDGHGHDEEE